MSSLSHLPCLLRFPVRLKLMPHSLHVNVFFHLCFLLCDSRSLIPPKLLLHSLHVKLSTFPCRFPAGFNFLQHWLSSVTILTADVPCSSKRLPLSKQLLLLDIMMDCYSIGKCFLIYKEKKKEATV